MTKMTDQQWMQRALELARRGIGTTHPNPRVGAVVVRDGQCVGEGWHERPGGAHAEVHALNQAGEAARGATIYVTLEPCAATGRTPPCTQAILKAGIKRVVFASSDPNPAMQGGGRFLVERGVEVTRNLCEQEADLLNAPFFRFIQTGMPYAIAKAAVSLDGKMATHTGDSRWISSKDSRTHAHALRASVDAIIVGGGTFRHDNPALNIRHVEYHHPAPRRVVITTSSPPFQAGARLLTETGGPVSFYISRTSEHDAQWIDAGIDIICHSNLTEIFRHLAATGALSVLVEGGGRLHGVCIEQQLIQECVLYQAPILIGGIDAPGFWQAPGIDNMDQVLHVDVTERQMLDKDQMIRGRIIYP